MWFNNNTKDFGYFQGPILADAPSGLFMKLRKRTIANTLDKLYEVALQEEARIKAWQENPTNDKFFSKNGGQFHFLDLTITAMKKPAQEVKAKIANS